MGLPQPFLTTQSWVLLLQTWAQGCNQQTLSTALPRQGSISEVDLSSLVNHSDSCGNSTLHAHLSVPPPQLFPHSPIWRYHYPPQRWKFFRIRFCNIGGFPVTPVPNNKELKTFMELFDLDLFIDSKSYLNWSKLLDNLHLTEWFHDILSCCTFTVHNTTENIMHHWFRGTFWIGTGLATQYITGSAMNPSGLGCWLVCTLLSDSGWCLHVIFSYCPCQNSCLWLHSVYTQQCQFFDSIDHYICHWAAFLQDLAQTINNLTQTGNKVLLLANFNGDIWQQEISTFTISCGLVESILSWHPSSSPPATFQQGN